MNKLIFAVSAIVIVIAGSAARAGGVVLTDENLDTITAGAANTASMSIVLPGVTFVSQCVGNSCTITVNGVICNSCHLVVNQSSITVTDASGRCMQWTMTWPSSTFSTAPVVSLPQSAVVLLAG